MLLAACCATALIAGTPASYPSWEPLAESRHESVEIDRRRIVRDRGFVEVWVRARGDRAAVAAEFVAAGAPPGAVARVREALDHSEHLWSFQCEDRTHALAVSSYWATDGSLIRRFDVARRTYWPVEPDTVGQQLMRAVCGRAQDAVAEDEDADADPRSRTEPDAADPSAEAPR